ncbi:MAG: transcriptional regulator [Provencibacterium sp.]|jgi:hypothetical protein|nr:transcriptional regulator [Provencibacterium sp.]
MPAMPIDQKIQLMVTIVDRGKGARVVDLYRSEQLHFNYNCLGLGTANSEILDYLGIGETEKDVVFTMIPAFRVKPLIRKASDQFQLHNPGKGILFTIPLTGVSGQVQRVLCKHEHSDDSKEEDIMQGEKQCDLILTILNHGYTDEVMAAAKKVGARGGTVLHARRVGFEDAENLLGFTIQPEKEIIAIIVPRSIKQGLMQEINRVAGLSTEKAGILFSLPIGDMAGLNFDSLG